MKAIVSSVLRRLQSQGPICSFIDEDPQPAAVGKTTLRGWVSHEKHLVRLQLRFKNHVLLETAPSIPRFDIAKGLPNHFSPLLSGFRVEVPAELLLIARPEEISLVAIVPREEFTIWSFAGHPSQSRAWSDDEIVARFAPQMLPGTEQLICEGVSKHLSIVLFDDASALRLQNALSSIARTWKSRTGWRLEQVVVCTAESRRLAAERLLQAQQLPPRSKRVVLTTATSWENVLSDCEETGAVLGISTAEELTNFQLLRLAENFRALPQSLVLQPGPYGFGCLRLPLALSPAELDSAAEKRALPSCLYPSRRLASVWTTSCRFLRAAEQHELLVRRHPGELGLPPDENCLYHFDLSIPLLNPQNIVLSQEERAAMQVTAEETLAPMLGTPPAKSSILIAIPSDWDEHSMSFGLGYQALATAQRFHAEGFGVRFVRDSTPEDGGGYAGGFPVLSLEEAANISERLDTKLVLAAAWDAVRTAHALRYIFRAPLAYVRSTEVDTRYETFRRDKRDAARWATRSVGIQVILNDSLRTNCSNRFLHDDDFIPQPVAVPELFLTLTRTTEEPAIAVLVRSSEHYSERQLDLLQEIPRALRREFPGREIVLGRLSQSHRLDVDASLAVKDCAIRNAEDLAALYASSDVVIDVSVARGYLDVVHEASAAGCRVIVTDPSALSSYVMESITAPLPVVCVETKAEAVSAAVRSQTQGHSFLKAKQTLAPDVVSQHEAQFLARNSAAHSARADFSVVIPVHNALEITLPCLRRLSTLLPQAAEAIVVDDASDEGTKLALQRFCARHKNFRLVRLDANAGFVQACLRGAKEARPENDLILLNSDVILSASALKALQDAAYSRFPVAAASALSTNSPHLQLDLNPGDSVDDAAELLASLRSPEHPTVITPEGQFLYLRRWALDEFGFFDEVYNRGFCEESDLLMRMFLSGCDTVCADNTLIYHRKSASFGLDGGKELKKQNRPIFEARWSRYYWPIYREFRRRDPLKEIRRVYKDLSNTWQTPSANFLPTEEVKTFVPRISSRPRLNSDPLGNADIVFILPSVVVGGGSLSVVQHVEELCLRGIRARLISLRKPDVPNLPGLAPAFSMPWQDVFQLPWKNQKVVATFWTTAYLVKTLRDTFPGINAYYYIQDYEPWFYSRPEEYGLVRDAEATYGFGLRGVAKTEFLAETVQKLHGVPVEVISPGIDLGTFYAGSQDRHHGRPRFAAMYRPATPRRGSQETLNFFRSLHARLPEVEVRLFGHDGALPEDIKPWVSSLGRIAPQRVARLYRESDFVVDFSHWHGFGRMGLEGMACGAMPILSPSGGIARYAQDGENAVIADPTTMDAVVDRVVQLCTDRELRMQLRQRGLETAQTFSEQRATDDWLRVFGLSTESVVEELPRRVNQ